MGGRGRDGHALLTSLSLGLVPPLIPPLMALVGPRIICVYYFTRRVLLVCTLCQFPHRGPSPRRTLRVSFPLRIFVSIFRSLPSLRAPLNVCTLGRRVRTMHSA